MLHGTRSTYSDWHTVTFTHTCVVVAIFSPSSLPGIRAIDRTNAFSCLFGRLRRREVDIENASFSQSPFLSWFTRTMTLFLRPPLSLSCVLRLIVSFLTRHILSHRAIITTYVDEVMIMWLSVESGVIQSVQSQLISHLFSLHFTLEQR
jgi:hypothetical protein